ncbi:MAG: hypothetical protein R3B06_13105 [Kofleriaceae bacterium]
MLLGAGLTACQFSPPPNIDSIDAAVDAPGQVQLTINVTHTDGSAGTVTVEPGGGTCSSESCNVFVEEGATVTVSATGATARDGVVAVSGDCGTLPCAVSATGPRTVNVEFRRFACGQPSSQRCDLGQLTQCDADGDFVTYDVPNGAPDGSPITLTMDGYQCPLGCFSDGTRCNDVDASNGLNAAMDSASVGPTGLDLVLPRTGNGLVGTARLDTNQFDATTGTVRIRDTDGQDLVVPAVVVTQAGGAPELLALQVRTLTVRPGTTLRIVGERSMAIVSNFDVYVGGVVDAGADLDFAGPGARAVDPACSGKLGMRGSGGGAGAGAFSDGGDGSDSTDTHGVSIGSFSHPLRGGCDGYYFGFGGGAIQVVSRRRVAIGAGGAIDVSGGGGICWSLDVAFPCTPSGGGGAGMVVIETPSLQVAAGAVVAGLGGSGAARNTSMPTIGVVGNDGGRFTNSSAVAVTCPGCGVSGAGATSTTVAGHATFVAPNGYAGGGGGCGGLELSVADGLVPPASALNIKVNGRPTLGRR